MDPESRQDLLLLELVRVYFDVDIAGRLENAVFTGWSKYGKFDPAATGPVGTRISVGYRCGRKHATSNRLFVKAFYAHAANVPGQQWPGDDPSLWLVVEAHFYGTVVPLFARMRPLDQLVPKFYAAGCKREGAYQVGGIALGNVERFRGVGCTTFLDREHLLVAVRKIAEFHAYSYEARRRNWQVRPGVSLRVHGDHMETVVETLRRCVEPLGRSGEFAGWVPRLRNLVDHLDFRVQQLMRWRDNDGTVLCHRNYSQANILFHFDNQRRMVTDLRIVNWECMGFASLGVDLVILLLVEAHPQTLRHHWKQLLMEYCNSLYATFENPLVPGFDRVYAEFIACVPLALYMLGLRANHLHLRKASKAAKDTSSLLWNEGMIADVLRDLIRRNIV